MARPRVVLVCGSREWTDPAPIRTDLEQLPPGSIIITGGANGADLKAGEVARALGFHVAAMPAEWHRHGKAAGPIRNAAMLLLRPEHVYAYDLGTPGTANMCKLAYEAGIPVTRRTAGGWLKTGLFDG